MQPHSPLDPVIRKLSMLHRLDADDEAAIARLPHTVLNPAAGTFLIDEGTRPEHFFALLEGFAYRSKSLADGRVQIVSFHMPGDLFDLRQLLNDRVGTDVVTLGPTTVAEIPVAALRALKASNPNVADALWQDSMLDSAIYREWIVNVGQREARERIAHMLAEFARRLEAAMPGSSEAFTVPMTQQQISAATGLSPVHVNRVIKRLALDGVFSKRAGRLIVNEPAALDQVADFQPGYLGPLSDVALGRSSQARPSRPRDANFGNPKD